MIVKLSQRLKSKQACGGIYKFTILLIEGSALVALAACVKQSDRLAGKNAALVLCDVNISLETLKGIM